MKVKVSKIVPKGFIGMTLWPFGIYVSEDKYLNDWELINHELIHWEQQKELIGIFFYLLYGIEWLIKSIFGEGRPYKRLAAEREANKHEENIFYLEIRKRYNWLKYIFRL